MILLKDPFSFVEEEAPPLDLWLPQLFRRPKAPCFQRGKAPIQKLVAQAAKAHQSQDSSGFGQAYGELLAEFQPAIQWALSCWEFLLSTEGCRFVLRSMEEKLYCRGDYRAFSQNDFQRIVYRTFKECLFLYVSGCDSGPSRRVPHRRGLNYAAIPPFETTGFRWVFKQTFWPTLLKNYRTLENPPDPAQRKLTGYSYLRCVPYQFLNPYHHERVHGTVKGLPPSQRQAVELYYLRFYKEEAAALNLRISLYAFWRRRKGALRLIAQKDYLSYILLNQIERY